MWTNRTTLATRTAASRTTQASQHTARATAFSLKRVATGDVCGGGQGLAVGVARWARGGKRTSSPTMQPPGKHWWSSCKLQVACVHEPSTLVLAGSYTDPAKPTEKLIKCAPLSEQINAILRRLDGHMSYMRQTTFLLYLRNFFYLQNEKAEGAE
jgi:hypothetical protein